MTYRRPRTQSARGALKTLLGWATRQSTLYAGVSERAVPPQPAHKVRSFQLHSVFLETDDAVPGYVDEAGERHPLF